MIDLMWIFIWTGINSVFCLLWWLIEKDFDKRFGGFFEKTSILTCIICLTFFIVFFIPIWCLKQALKIIEMIIIFCGEEK